MRFSVTVLTLAVLTTLAACHGAPEDPPANNLANDIIENEANETVVNDAPAPVTVTNSAVSNKMAPPKVSEEQQMQDDADATGMTSRLPEDKPAMNVAGK